MMKTKKILEFMGLIDEEDESSEEIGNEQLFEAEISEIIEELSAHHADSKEYKQGVENLKTFTEAYHNYERAVTEKDKVIVEQKNADKQWKIKFIDVAPRVIGLVGSVGLTALWFMVEQNHPTANRLINKTNDLLVRP